VSAVLAKVLKYQYFVKKVFGVISAKSVAITEPIIFSHVQFIVGIVRSETRQ